MAPRVKSSTDAGYNFAHRPVRAAAGRRSLPAGFVDIDDVEELSAESSDSEAGGIKRYKQRRVRPAGPPSPQHHVPYASSSRESSPEPDGRPLANFAGDQKAPAPTLSFTFHVPEGHNGPFVVNFSLKDIDAALASQAASLSQWASPKRAFKPIVAEEKKTDQPASYHKTRISFNDLPPEIRNMIYRALFVGKDKLEFYLANFCLSSQFLRTCSQVYLEGAPVLYGQNSFLLQRETRVSGYYWKKPWFEIGWKNVRLWLNEIGPAHVALLRDLELNFDDGSPSGSVGNPRLTASWNIREGPRYVYDSQLIACLEILAKSARLRELTLTFLSRKKLTRRDDRFLHYLKHIQADRLDVSNGHAYCVTHQLDSDIKGYLKQKMERKIKLYKEQKSN